MKSLALAILALLLAACSTASIQESEAREYRHRDWKLRYIAYADTCSRAGGRMIVQRYGRARTARLAARSDQFRCTASIGRPPIH